MTESGVTDNLKIRTKMNIIIKKVTAADDIQTCLEIRKKVFIEGRQVSEIREREGDEESEHYLLLLNNIPTGAARIRYLENKAKIERVAILDEARGLGLGKKLMEFLIEEISQGGKAKIAALGAQVHAISFYEKLGFKICSEEYLDAGIAHKDMSRSFN